MQFWYRIAPWLFIISLLLLGLVLLPFIPEINGARRWISLGFIRFQPSEIAKFAILLYAANYMIRKMEVRERFSHAILPMVIALSITGSLLLSEPDMGAFLIVSIIALGILFLGGVKLRTLLLLLLVITIVFMLSVLMVSWRLERFFAYLDPWDDAYALGKGYQLTNALIAIGRGGVFGVGLGASVEKLHWLPESHTDFLLAIIGEELGLIGIVVLVILFFGLSHRLILIGRQAITMERVFSGLVIQGIALWFASQAFIHMGVNLGVLPTTGLTLPFMSYGGSALVINLLAIALALRVDYENQQLMQGGRP
jgi:cell division protein FtsW